MPGHLGGTLGPVRCLLASGHLVPMAPADSQGTGGLVGLVPTQLGGGRFPATLTRVCGPPTGWPGRLQARTQAKVRPGGAPWRTCGKRQDETWRDLRSHRGRGSHFVGLIPPRPTRDAATPRKRRGARNPSAGLWLGTGVCGPQRWGAEAAEAEPGPPEAGDRKPLRRHLGLVLAPWRRHLGGADFPGVSSGRRQMPAYTALLFGFLSFSVRTFSG